MVQLTDAEVIALVPCPYKRCSSPTGIPCINTDMSHKSRASAAFLKVRRQENDALINSRARSLYQRLSEGE